MWRFANSGTRQSKSKKDPKGCCRRYREVGMRTIVVVMHANHVSGTIVIMGAVVVGVGVIVISGAIVVDGITIVVCGIAVVIGPSCWGDVAHDGLGQLQFPKLGKRLKIQSSLGFPKVRRLKIQAPESYKALRHSTIHFASVVETASKISAW